MEDRGLRWLQKGSTTLNLGFPIGFPIGFNMAQQEKNAKVLQQIRSKLALWNNRKLSMAAHILVSNQAILALIWYIASGADLLRSILQKARSMVRNFVWGNDAGKNSWAKIKWDSTILSTTHSGIKIFDPYAQASALFAKIITTGLTPGLEFWKILLRQWVNQLQFKNQGDWHTDLEWLFSGHRVRTQGSPLWQGIWAAWLEVRP